MRVLAAAGQLLVALLVALPASGADLALPLRLRLHVPFKLMEAPDVVLHGLGTADGIVQTPDHQIHSRWCLLAWLLTPLVGLGMGYGRGC